jgi:hypothetical protein
MIGVPSPLSSSASASCLSPFGYDSRWIVGSLAEPSSRHRPQADRGAVVLGAGGVVAGVGDPQRLAVRGEDQVLGVERARR